VTVAESRRDVGASGEERARGAGVAAAGVAAARDPDSSALLVERLAALGSDAAEGTLLSATVAAPAADPIDLFDAARALGLEPGLWIQESAGLAFVGMGHAWSVEPAGPARFLDADVAWRALVAGARIEDDSGETRGTGPLLFGGFAFDPAGGTDPCWTGYGRGRLSLPRLLWTRTPHGTWLTASAVTAEGPAGDRSVADQWAAVCARAAASASAAVSERAAGPARATVSQRAAASERSTGRDGAGDADPTDARVPTLRIDGGEPGAAAWRTVASRFAGAVGRGRLDKVVLARRVDLRSDIAIDIGATLRRLVGASAESTVFAIARGEAVFLGASPERLVRTEGRDARTVAIAGSTRRGADAAEDDALARALLADEKEREEHEVVVRMLRDSLAPLCDDLDVAPAPRVIRLRTVQHLCTDVTARTSDRAGILSLVGVLHPTPAVGGQPRTVALDLIRDQERLDRGWYAAPLGWLDRDGDGEFIVALRSGVVSGDRASLFAGCGIVADSEPDREWEESRMKLRALGSALGTVEL
jgi:isochorismate synthase